MTYSLNPNLLDTATPPIPEARAWTARYDGRLGPLIDLSQAAPAVSPPPAMLKKLAAAAADPAIARYGPIEGEPELRDALALETNAIYGAGLSAANVAITSGCNEAFFIAMLALAKAGDSVLLPLPWYFNHQMALRMLGIEARPLLCEAQNGFVPDVARAAALIEARTRALVLVTPNNPTGAIYPPQTIAAFADLCRRKNIALVIDETYRDFLANGAGRPHELFSDDGWRDRVLQLYSFSKSYAVPGYRLGAIVAGQTAIRDIAKILDTLQICPARVGQAAVAWAVEALRGWRAENRADIHARAAAFLAAMKEAPGWRIDSIGAYFAFVRHPFAEAQAARVAERLAVERGVLALPDQWFGGDGRHLRVAFANAPMAMLAALPGRLAGLKP